MAKKRHRKKKSILRSRFYRIYFLLVALCIAGIVLGVRYINTLLEDYESAQPVYVARQAARLFESADYESIYAYDTAVQGAQDVSAELYARSLREISAGKQLSWTESYSPSEDEKIYSVSLDGEKFAQFSLVPSGQRTAKGNRLWKLSSVTTQVTVAEPEPTPEPTPVPTPAPAIEQIACTVTVPDDFSVTVDGVPMDANNVIKADIPTASDGLLPEGVKSPTLIQYAFLKGESEPVIEVRDAGGNPQTLTQNSETDFSCGLVHHPELQAEYEEAVVRVAKNISSYSAKDASEAAVLQYCARNCPARDSIKDFDNTWGTRHNGAKFENVQTFDYFLYSEDCFSCRVTFDYVATFGKSTVKTYPTAYTLYFIKENGKGKLYNFTLY